MNIDLYRNQSTDAKSNAQANLAGRTHYVEDATLRWHHGRVLSARATAGGLLFAIVESVALDPQNRERGVRYVIFNVFGTVVGTRQDLDNTWKRSAQAEKAMWEELKSLDAIAITREGITNAEKYFAMDMDRLRGACEKIEGDKALSA